MPIIFFDMTYWVINYDIMTSNFEIILNEMSAMRTATHQAINMLRQPTVRVLLILVAGRRTAFSNMEK